MSVLIIAAVGTSATGTDPAQLVQDEDPPTAVEEAQPGALFEYFLAAFSRLNARQYQEARQLIGRLDRATLPSNVQSALYDLNALMVQQGSLVEVVDRWVRDITALTQAGRTADAQRLLTQLDAQVRRADLLFGELAGGIQDLRGRLEGEVAANPSHRAAFDQLQHSAARIKVFLTAYRATSKNPASVAAIGRLLPFETLIELDELPAAYPGRAVVVSGNVRERAPSPSRDRRLTVYFDGRLVAVEPAKAFRIQFTVPEDAATGEHRLLAEVPTQGRYLGAAAWRTIQISRITPTLVADLRKWVTVPGQLSVSGSVTSELGPLRNATVRASIGEKQYQTTTSELGTFRVSLDLPAALELGGPAALSIFVLPNEPWFTPVTQGRSIVIVNLASVGLLGATLIGGVVLLSKRAGRRILVEVREGPAAAPVAPTPLPTATAPVRVAGSLAEELLAIYRQVLRRVEATIGTRAEVSTTLREFASIVPLQQAGGPLWRMTELAELALYSPHPVTPALVEQTRALESQLEGAFAGV
jgi:hypothetical protein